MTVQQLHTIVEQDVQKISSFAYEDMLPEEVDIQANKSFYQMLNDFADLKRVGNRMDDTEARLNDIRTVVVRDTNISVAVIDSSVSVASLPENYLYLVGVGMSVLYKCSKIPMTTLTAQSYIVESGSITINNTTYTAGKIINNVSTITVPKNVVIYRLGLKKVYGRIVRNEDVNFLQDHVFGKSTYKSPVTTITGNQLFIYTNDFFIKDIKITYIRKPKIINIATPTDTIDLSENGAYKLARLVVLNITEVTEQPQQKIENLKNQ